jgi:CubicO group peptidase (beta-lactamase class C family)
MTSGYDAIGYRETHAHASGRGDWGPDPYDPDTPLFHPGTRFCYHDEAAFMFGRILTVIAKQTLYSFLKYRITDPAGIRSWIWPTEGKVNGTDINQGCSGITMSANQLARWGYLFLNRGNWNGQQFIGTAWIDQATQNQVPVTVGVIVDKQRQADGRGSYGFGWWLNGNGPDGMKKLPDAPSTMYWAAGFNNNMCFVIPDWNMVVVRLGTRGVPTNFYEVWNNFFEKLGRSVAREGSVQPGG